MAVARAQGLLATFGSASLHSNELRTRTEEEQTKNPLALSQREAMTENITMLTSMSDDFQINPSNLAKLDTEVKEHKSYLSQVKFSWAENNIKRRFVHHILVEDSPSAITNADNVALETERSAKKARLKKMKTEADELQATFVQDATSLDAGMNRLTPALEEMQTLTRSITSMELELSMLRASKPNTMSVVQANSILDTQVQTLQTSANTLSTSRVALQEAQTRHNALKERVEGLQSRRGEIERAAEGVKRNTRDYDGSLAAGCRWYTTALVLLKGLLGVKKVEMVNDSMRISYGLEEGKEIVLDLRFDGKSGHFIGAELLNSAESIQELSKRAVMSGDVRQVVREIVSRCAPPFHS